MFSKVICIILAISLFSSFSKATQINESNETGFFPLLSSPLLKLKHLQEPDIPLLRENLQLLREEVGQLKKDVVDKESSIQQLRAEVDRQRINEAVQDSSIQLLKAEIERLVKKSNLRNCNEANSSGIHDIVIPNFSSEPFTVACDAETRGGGWTIILRRMDGSVDFNRTWNSYKNGFGDLEGEFFLGLDKIHALTAERNQELLVLLEDQDGIEAFENYESFAIGDEEEQYILHELGNASGSAGDSLTSHRGMKFSTFDRDNDIGKGNCAKIFTGGWWYRNCHNSHLTGLYNDNNPGKGINWTSLRDYTHSLKKRL